MEVIIRFTGRIISGNAVEYLQDEFSREFKVLKDLGAQLVEAKEHRYTATRSMDWDGVIEAYQLEMVDVTFKLQVSAGDTDKVLNFLDLLLELDYEFRYSKSLS